MNHEHSHKQIVRSILLAASLMIVTLFFFIPYITEEYSTNTIVSYAKNSAKQIKLTRAYYTKSVVGDVKKYAPNLSFSYNHQGVNGVLPLPTTMVHDLSNLFSKNTGLTYSLYSRYPFKNRADRVLTAFQEEAIKFTNENPDGIYIKKDIIDNKEVLRVATTDYMVDVRCVTCHNNHPDRTWGRNKWKVGDKRGVLEVIVPMDEELAAHRQLRNYILAFVAVVFSSILFYLFLVLRGREKELLDVADNLESEVETLSSMMDKHVIVSKTDPNGIITYISQAFSDISGYSKEELIGQPHNIVRNPDMSEEALKELWNTILSKNMWVGDIKNRAKDGSSYYVHSTIFPNFNSQGEVVEYVAFRDDITQRVLTQKAVEKEKAFNQVISDNQQSILSVSRKEDGVQSLNKKFFDVFDFKDLEDFKKDHRCICELFIEKEGYLKASTDEENWIDIPLKHSDVTYKALMKNKYGEERIFTVLIKEVEIENTISYVSTFMDITELEQARELAESSEKMRSEFMANMSHEIRTPMNAISGFLQLLGKTKMDQQQNKHLSIINSSMKNLLGIVHDVLDFSKLDNGKMQLSLTESNPFSVFKESLELFKVSASQKNISYNIHIDTRISQCLYIDSLRISQVLSNLVSNAIKFTDNGKSIDVDIVLLNSSKIDEKISFSVADTGIGIPKHKQGKIFEAFSQLDSSTTRKFGGTGLGLSISASLVEVLGGTLKLESIKGDGSNFFFELTFRKCNTKNIEPRQFATLNHETSSRTFEGLEVLVAEDNEFNYILMDELLQQYKIKATFVHNGQEAVDILNHRSFDLLFMDVNMPILNGLDATKQIRANKNNLPIIALTANALEGDREKFLASGMDNYLAKPIDIDALEKILHLYANK